ncbi:MAG: hypothetical protein J6T96_03705 [Bacteroidales bacterium]|nr:hypothetical protein [Bacteroidales bacterium]
MNATFSLDTLLNLLSGLSLDNRVWLAEHLVNPTEKAKIASAKEVGNNGWPKIRREDLRVSADVVNLVKGFELPVDADYDDLKLEYLMKKHG